MTIHFSSPAKTHIKNILQKEQSRGLRLSIKKTGCSGYSYVTEVMKAPKPDDIIFIIQDGEFEVFVDPNWLHLLAGMTIDYVEEKTGLKQRRLLFINPNESNRCGCGESFHVEQSE